MQQILGITILYVTHDQGEALSLPDRIIVMNKGRLIQEGSPEDVYNHPKTPFVADFIGNANFFDVSVLAIDESDIHITLHEQEFRVPLSHCDHKPTKDEQLLLSINPIAITISQYSRTCEANQTVGIVEQCLFNGQSYEYTISFSDTSLRVIQPNIQDNTPNFPEQSEVLLTFNPSSFHLFGTGG